MTVRLMLVLTLTIAALSVSPVRATARPAGPSDCTFAQVFTAFREALGPDIIGDCQSTAATDESGNQSQQTENGTLYWDGRINAAAFDDSTRMWWDGPAGIGSNITISGLSDSATTRAPVVAPAARVLELALLDLDELGSGWEASGTTEAYSSASGQRVQAECARDVPRRAAGDVTLRLFDRAHRVQVTHRVQALPDAAIAYWRTDAEKFASACAEWTERVGSSTYKFTLEMLSFSKHGDDSFVHHMQFEQLGSGSGRQHVIAMVRYGGLVSMVAVTGRPEQTLDDVMLDVERVVKLAESRVQSAAWYLRP